jgi:hypothetical protein
MCGTAMLGGCAAQRAAGRRVFVRAGTPLGSLRRGSQRQQRPQHPPAWHQVLAHLLPPPTPGSMQVQREFMQHSERCRCRHRLATQPLWPRC